MSKNKHKILIADRSPELLKSIKTCKEAKNFHIETATSGEQCLKKIEKFQPELIIVDFMLPGVHGIEILKIVRQAPKMKKIGVIVTSFLSMVQNYHVAIKQGANYFLEKPFTTKQLFTLASRFFDNKLIPAPFSEHKKPKHEETFSYIPENLEHTSYIKFWGTRGSNPVAGPEYVRFGGNTCCLEIRHGKDLVIIDAGTGIRSLGSILEITKNTPFHILFSHTHWDHLLGFPFFKPIYHPDSEVHLWAPVGFDKNTKELFSEMLAYSYFPVALDDIKSKISFEDIRDSQKISFGKIDVYTHYAFHPGATLCFRIHIGGKKIGYVTDNEFLMGYNGNPNKVTLKDDRIKPYESFIKFFKGCDLMIHEAQYTPDEYKIREGWGHSSISNASKLMKLAGIHDWIVTHHDPRHSDDDLLKKAQIHLEVMKDLKHNCQIRMAHDGMFIPI
jgi:ribonuclease BN (tRNA processing enzyme)/FixJ family two-component response regulator